MSAPSVIGLYLVSRTRSLILALCGASFVLTACAKESSKEERQREEHDRQFRRLQKAEGHYAGFVEMKDGKIVPMALDLAANRTPSNGSDNPSLSAAVKLGLFGGVVLSTNVVSFDWGNGNVTISLPKQSGGAGSDDPDKTLSLSAPITRAAAAPTAALELRGSMNDDGLANGVIDGPISGSHSVTLKKDGTDLFSEQDHFTYQTQITGASALGGSVINNSQLYLNRRSGQRPSSNSSDLPSLPAFDASIRFANLAAVPSTASDVVYDPLLGSMDIRFGANTVLRVNDIFMDKTALTVALSDWQPTKAFTGRILLGATNYGSVHIGPEFPGVGLAANAPTINDLPPRTYVGTYTTKDETLQFTTLALITYENAQGTNAAEFPFASFPVLTLRILVCSGNDAFSDASYKVEAMDQIRNLARMRAASATEDKQILDLTYTTGWQSIVGKFRAPSSGGQIDFGNSQLKLWPVTVSEFSCSSI